MKTRNQTNIWRQNAELIGFLIFALCLSALVFADFGCKNPEVSAYKTAKVTQVTVDTAMHAWGDYVAQFHPPVAQEQKVKNAFDKYKATELLVVDASQAYAANKDATPLNAALATAAASLSDLLAVIRSFGVKI